MYTCEIPSEAKDAFVEATKDIIGVKYSPVAVSTQVVQGKNYKFFCNTETELVLPPTYGAAIVSIYAPLEGQAHITHIQTL